MRFHPDTLVVDIDDLTFATSTGSLVHGSSTITSVPYAVALDCRGGGSRTGLANVDLSGTPFAVADTFFTNGFIPGGTVLFGSQTVQLNTNLAEADVSGFQVVDLRGGGFCGGTGPRGVGSSVFTWVRANANISPKPVLNLTYIGHRLVHIDIKPGSDPNAINLKSGGVVPVAILSTASFDATGVDAQTLTFGASGDEDSLARRGRGRAPQCGVEDVNTDGLPDLVCHFETQNAGFQFGDTNGVLKGLTAGGTRIWGSDTVRTVGT